MDALVLKTMNILNTKNDTLARQIVSEIASALETELCRELQDQCAELAAVTEERDRMRQSINSMIIMLEMACETLERPTHCPLEVGQRHSPLSQKEIIQRLTETCSFVRADLSRVMDEARAALEGVTEKEGAGNE